MIIYVNFYYLISAFILTFGAAITAFVLVHPLVASLTLVAVQELILVDFVMVLLNPE